MSVYVNNSVNTIDVNPLFNTVNVIPDGNSTIVQVVTPGPQGPPGNPALLTGSFVSITEFNTFTASYNETTSSFATTGSNRFVGDQIVSGNLTISGTLDIGSNYIQGLGIEGPSNGWVELLFQSESILGYTGINPYYNYSTFFDGINSNELQIYGDKSIFLQSVEAPSFTGSLFGTSSHALNADALNGLNSSVFAITGSNIFKGNQTITGSLSITNQLGTSFFLINNQGTNIIQSNASNIFIIQNQNNIALLTVSQSGILLLATQSLELTTSAPNGGIYFTSSSLYIGLD